jgi:ATP-dependent Zn protease
MTKQFRERVAYHEAGHAVMSDILSVPLDFVTIKSSEENAGVAVNVGGQPVNDTSDINTAIVCFAGPIAEVEFCGKDSDAIFSWRNDYADIRQRLIVALEESLIQAAAGRTDFSIDYSGFDTAYRSLRAKTKQDALDLVRAHKSAIERVAQALIKYKTLNGKQVRKLVQSTKGSRRRMQSAKERAKGISASISLSVIVRQDEMGRTRFSTRFGRASA